MLFDQPPAHEVPKPVRVSAEELKKRAGIFRFGEDFFQKNAEMRIEARSDYLEMVYPATGFSASLIPIQGGQFFDRLFWSFVRFENGQLVYRNNDKDYVAKRTYPAPRSG